ncbi:MULTISPECIES: hypothetical protein [unclassified Pseudoalteromonas]|uniref:hypothetical protein n=1 Tax=unclassified Pseudoalteromonas TaxID=194690 RepID=UPI00110BDEB6|nr:hypothetical protein [Pseudoalteromonas sp. S4492]TMO28283.1 hypothetical protein CWC28_08950 [Pseudoalteromonas sp. S4492]|tara:strand:+ start:72 stop:389 length:318 start_codon:yes stop_codon:yes gene_type:complete
MQFDYLKLYACLTLSGLTIWSVDQAWTMYQLKLVSDATSKAMSQVSQPKKTQVRSHKPSYKPPSKENQIIKYDKKVCKFFLDEYRKEPTESNKSKMMEYCPISSN